MANPPAAPSQGLQRGRQASVRIEHRINLPGTPSEARRLAESSSGTVVGPHTILTHGHNIPFGDPAYLSERLIISVREQGILSPHLVQVAEVSRPFADPSTTLLVLPDRVPLGEPAILGDPAELQVGDPVTMLYWDDAHERFAELETTIAQIEGGIATLEDPALLINQGDSGSGMYNVRGELVGNVRSIVQSNRGQRLPWIEVGLQPQGIGHLASG